MWANEQAIRETYLKPFEICVKEARGTLNYTSDSKGTKSSKVIRGCSAVMTSFTMIGTTMCSSDYSLTNSVLRDEWGFEGMVITDFGPAVNHDAMLRAGNDFLLNASWTGTPASIDFFADYTSNTAKHVFRQAIKNMCYTVVNSNAYNGIAPGSTSYRDIAPWRILVGCIAGVLYAGAAVGTGFTTYYFVDEKKNPGRHKTKLAK
jgi:beta-glucosidase